MVSKEIGVIKNKKMYKIKLKYYFLFISNIQYIFSKTLNLLIFQQVFQQLFPLSSLSPYMED